MHRTHVIALMIGLALVVGGLAARGEEPSALAPAELNKLDMLIDKLRAKKDVEGLIIALEGIGKIPGPRPRRLENGLHRGCPLEYESALGPVHDGQQRGRQGQFRRRDLLAGIDVLSELPSLIAELGGGVIGFGYSPTAATAPAAAPPAANAEPLVAVDRLPALPVRSPTRTKCREDQRTRCFFKSPGLLMIANISKRSTLPYTKAKPVEGANLPRLGCMNR